MMTNAVKIIGLTGNIATGKSVVRRMLSNFGALGIDADDISHRMLYPGAPAYQPVVDAFGVQILSSQDKISREKLGEIVFNDKQKLNELEKLIHPWVTKAIKKRAQKTSAPLVIIEAIKLFESDLIDLCDTIWVSHASEEHQLRRLQKNRHLSHEQALERISAQSLQSEKILKADAVINTEGTFKNTWEHIQNALNQLNDTIQVDNHPTSKNINNSNDWHMGSAKLLLKKERMHQWKCLTSLNSQEIYKYLGTQMILPLFQDKQCESLIFWDNWDFTAAMSIVYPDMMSETNTTSIFNAFQDHAQYNQCEVLLLPESCIASMNIHPGDFGYKQQIVTKLSYPSWQAAAKKQTQKDHAEIWVKVIAQPIETEERLTS
jgi:dephospho-CoA kinase